MNSKHTPGNWQRNIKPASKYPTVFAGRNTHICYLNTQEKSEGELEANIQLICAAPELAEALKAILSDYLATREAYVKSCKSCNDTPNVKRARLALQKAGME